MEGKGSNSRLKKICLFGEESFLMLFKKGEGREEKKGRAKSVNSSVNRMKLKSTGLAETQQPLWGPLIPM